VRITTKGQVTIPIEIRERLGLLPNTEVEFEPARDGVVLRKVRRGARRGERVIAQLRGRGTVPLTTDQILALTRDGRPWRACWSTAMSCSTC
jgi:AbrB family looped-hinge helix DNA binding protein